MTAARTGAAPGSRAALDVLTVGEAMAVFCPDPPGPLRHAPTLRMSVAGAEANVVTHLAGLGLSTMFASRVGDDPFGELIRDTLAAAGVEVAVAVEVARPTGIYFKDPGGYATQVHYYRAGSAASTMDATLWKSLPAARLVHLSGITPAISPSCAELIRVGLAERPVPGAAISFDVNYRPRLWEAAEAAPVLAALANRADLVFVGLDEAALLWGATSAEEVRAVIDGPAQLVVKDGAVGATLFVRAAGAEDAVVFEPTTPVEVVEPVGAGDAFAAGYLYGLLTGAAPANRLRYGHRLAAAALVTVADVGSPLSVADLAAADRSALAGLGADAVAGVDANVDAAPTVVVNIPREPGDPDPTVVIREAQ